MSEHATASNLIFAVTPVLVPVLVAALKKMIGSLSPALIPLVAIAAGTLIDVINAYVTTGALQATAYGPLLGAAGIGVREVLDQVKKWLSEPAPGR